MSVDIINADCRAALEFMPSNSIDSVVTDPPYALVSISKRFGKKGSAPAKHGTDGLYARQSAGFMGKMWDNGSTAFDPKFWADVLRVLKPGGHVLAFGGTRTYHRLACAVEDAGFEIRDQIGWTYGSGFPKSHNQRDEWEGWGTALKPAWEPIVMARKPLIETVGQNLAMWRTGALNIDGCRIALGDDDPLHLGVSHKPHALDDTGAWGFKAVDRAPGIGRWPANLIHDGSNEVLAAFPSTKSGVMKAGTMRAAQDVAGSVVYGVFGGRAAEQDTYGDSGSAARFFYCAKASRTDRNEGLDAFESKPLLWSAGTQNPGSFQSEGTDKSAKNPHPTVKPTALMQWLCRLVTPPGGVVLDPFMGSGSTGKAAVLEGFRFVGVELDAHYCAIAKARIHAASRRSGVFA